MEWRRGRHWRRIRHGLEVGGGSAAFLTLTVRSGTPEDHVMKSWNTFRGWLRRRVAREGGSLEYVAVKEPTKRGTVHLHVLCIGWAYIPQAEISQAWLRATGHSYIVDVRAADAGSVNYLTKYVAKALGGRTVREVSYSRGWPSLEDGPAGEGSESGKVLQRPPGVSRPVWKRTGVEVGPEGPAGAPDYITESGVLIFGEPCEHMPDARPLTLADHLYLRRLARGSGPPGPGP